MQDDDEFFEEVEEDVNNFDGLYDDEFFEEMFVAQQQEKWETGEYVDHCEGCEGEDCPCCQYNTDNDY